MDKPFIWQVSVCVCLFTIYKKRKLGLVSSVCIQVSGWGWAEKEKEGRTERNGEKEREEGRGEERNEGAARHREGGSIGIGLLARW